MLNLENIKNKISEIKSICASADFIPDFPQTYRVRFKEFCDVGRMIEYLN